MNGEFLEDIEWICETYYTDVYQYFLYFTNNRNDAEDLTQETFIKVIKRLESYKQQAKLKTWILSIAKNTAIDYYRRKKLIQFIPDLFSNQMKAKNHLPEQELEIKESWLEVENAMITLKPAYRNVLILRGIQEFSIKETAEILQCSENKVRVDYHRALKELNNKITTDERRLLLNEKS